MRTLLPLLALLGTLQLAEAQSALRWDKKVAEVQPGPAEKTAKADFVFTNISKEPVVIGSVKPGCGCTTAALEKKTYQPGEKGHITAVFTIGGRRGVQAKAITVNVRGESEPTVLTMVTRVSEPIRIDPPLVTWKNGETPRSKTIKLSLPAGMKVERVASSDPKISAKLENSKGGEYQITVTPEATAQKTMATLSIQTTSRNTEPKTLTAYAQVKGP